MSRYHRRLSRNASRGCDDCVAQGCIAITEVLIAIPVFAFLALLISIEPAAGLGLTAATVGFLYALLKN